MSTSPPTMLYDRSSDNTNPDNHALVGGKTRASLYLLKAPSTDIAKRAPGTGQSRAGSNRARGRRKRSSVLT